MKKLLLVFALILISSATLFGQQGIKSITANFDFNWNEYLLPNCSFLIYQGTNESYFIDSLGSRIPNHSYISIKTGGKHHFIVQNKSGFHILDTSLSFVTQKAYDNIKLNFGSEIELTLNDKTTYFTWDYEENTYTFTDIQEPTPPWETPKKRVYDLELGKITDSRFKAK